MTRRDKDGNTKKDKLALGTVAGAALLVLGLYFSDPAPENVSLKLETYETHPFEQIFLMHYGFQTANYEDELTFRTYNNREFYCLRTKVDAGRIDNRVLELNAIAKDLGQRKCTVLKRDLPLGVENYVEEYTIGLYEGDKKKYDVDYAVIHLAEGKQLSSGVDRTPGKFPKYPPIRDITDG